MLVVDITPPRTDSPDTMRHRFLAHLVSAGLLCAAGDSAAQHLQKVLDSQEIRVCIWPEYYGITFRNPRTRALSGIDIDLSAEFAKELGVQVRYVDSSFAQLADNLLSGQCDIAMHAVGITAERLTRLAFSSPYMKSDMYAVISQSNQSIKSWSDLDKPGHVIAVLAGTVMEPVMQKKLRYAKLLLIRPPMTREQEVESGRADAFMTDYPYSRRLIETSDWAKLIAPPQTFHITEYAYALAPGDTTLLERINRFIETIKRDGRLQNIAKKHKLDSIIVKD